MTLTRIFPNTTPVKDYEAFRQRAINLYREWLREIPRAVQKYPLDISVAAGRSRVRQEFQKYAKLFSTLPPTPTKLPAMNAALLKGTQELIEVHNRWSQKTHVMRWFEGAGEIQSPAKLQWESSKEIKELNEGINLKDKSSFLNQFLTQSKK